MKQSFNYSFGRLDTEIKKEKKNKRNNVNELKSESVSIFSISINDQFSMVTALGTGIYYIFLSTIL